MYTGLAAEKNLYNDMVDIGVKSGLKTIVAKVHAVLFMEPEEISLEEIATKTGYSLASVSNAAKQLELFKKARRIKKPGSKKVYYKGEKNLVCEIHDHIQKTMEGVIKPMQERMPRLIKELKNTLKEKNLTKEKKEELKNKIKWYESYNEQNHLLGTIFGKIEKEFHQHEYTYR